MSYALLRDLLFLLPPETSHHLTLHALKTMHGLGVTRATSDAPEKAVSVWGMPFPNRVGLAAGLDKNGDYIDALSSLGFGFVEIGTVTPRPQPGNPKPRLFRLPKANAIINRMGFNNLGIDHLVEQVKSRKSRSILGINIGKNFDTPIDKAVDDYLIGLRKAYAHADYVTVNISSPNTKDLRQLQESRELQQLLEQLKKTQQQLNAEHKKYVPIALKIAPDLTPEQLQHIANQLLQFEIDGVIATNTTVTRSGVEGLPHASETGGLSGGPLTEKSTEVVKQLHAILGKKIPIIAAGGILNGHDAQQKIQAGATLVQIYTGFIYRGPALIKELKQSI